MLVNSTRFIHFETTESVTWPSLFSRPPVLYPTDNLFKDKILFLVRLTCFKMIVHVDSRKSTFNFMYTNFLVILQRPYFVSIGLTSKETCFISTSLILFFFAPKLSFLLGPARIYGCLIAINLPVRRSICQSVCLSVCLHLLVRVVTWTWMN